MIKDCSSLLDFKGRFNTLPDNQKKEIILSLVLQSEMNINDETKNELIATFLKECPDYKAFYNNISFLNRGLENIKLRYSSIT